MGKNKKAKQSSTAGPVVAPISFGLLHCCAKCGLRFDHIDTLVEHYHSDHEAHYACHVCSEHFSSLKERMQHIHYTEGVQATTDLLCCYFCTLIVNDRTVFLTHISSCHAREFDQLRCRQCARVLPTRYSLSLHAEFEHGDAVGKKPISKDDFNVVASQPNPSGEPENGLHALKNRLTAFCPIAAGAFPPPPIPMRSPLRCETCAYQIFSPGTTLDMVFKHAVETHAATHFCPLCGWCGALSIDVRPDGFVQSIIMLLQYHQCCIIARQQPVLSTTIPPSPIIQCPWCDSRFDGTIDNQLSNLFGHCNTQHSQSFSAMSCPICHSLLPSPAAVWMHVYSTHLSASTSLATLPPVARDIHQITKKVEQSVLKNMCKLLESPEFAQAAADQFPMTCLQRRVGTAFSRCSKKQCSALDKFDNIESVFVHSVLEHGCGYFCVQCGQSFGGEDIVSVQQFCKTGRHNGCSACYNAPGSIEPAFNCPWCGFYTERGSGKLAQYQLNEHFEQKHADALAIQRCIICKCVFPSMKVLMLHIVAQHTSSKEEGDTTATASGSDVAPPDPGPSTSAASTSADVAFNANSTSNKLMMILIEHYTQPRQQALPEQRCALCSSAFSTVKDVLVHIVDEHIGDDILQNVVDDSHDALGGPSTKYPPSPPPPQPEVPSTSMALDNAMDRFVKSCNSTIARREINAVKDYVRSELNDCKSSQKYRALTKLSALLEEHEVEICALPLGVQMTALRSRLPTMRFKCECKSAGCGIETCKIYFSDLELYFVHCLCEHSADNIVLPGVQQFDKFCDFCSSFFTKGKGESALEHLNDKHLVEIGNQVCEICSYIFPSPLCRFVHDAFKHPKTQPKAAEDQGEAEKKVERKSPPKRRRRIEGNEAMLATISDLQERLEKQRRKEAAEAARREEILQTHEMYPHECGSGGPIGPYRDFRM